uniref:Uncharacterized protein n=1 Tax=Candidatus Kentrum sp. FM TaxID=2126340 RepID=A0A450SE86_9GAMM|nr:MAG: hypothetical protein BECKFM1743C_GA0114222_100923 [Candidatus Kentron sp. FM]VFJ51031.1 MAG: hypothetical protein BECKFM1743A_GA0114220_100903 [Candidatus Kentron sp. FM]VFK08808.1 MAG: hypothetical protein BECKFM1743B_GA0114221_100823 [Candidatus Kentron sp. FM]
MADRCNYPSEIDMDGRIFGGEHLGSPYAPPNVGANLVFAHYARFALMPKSCDSTALCYTHSVDQPGIR